MQGGSLLLVDTPLHVCVRVCVRVCVCTRLFCKRDLAMQGGSLLILDNPLHTEPSMHVCVCEDACLWVYVIFATET